MKESWAVSLTIHAVEVVEAESRDEADKIALQKLANEIIGETSKNVHIIVSKRVVPKKSTKKSDVAITN